MSENPLNPNKIKKELYDQISEILAPSDLGLPEATELSEEIVAEIFPTIFKSSPVRTYEDILKKIWERLNEAVRLAQLDYPEPKDVIQSSYEFRTTLGLLESLRTTYSQTFRNNYPYLNTCIASGIIAFKNHTQVITELEHFKQTLKNEEVI